MSKSFILEIAGDAIRTINPEQLKEQVADALADARQDTNKKSFQHCEICNGTGEWPMWCDAVDGLGEHTTRHWVEDCSECNGTGEVEQ